VEDPERFPSSLKGMTDHIHRKGIKMMVWFEPERVTAGSLFHQEHPEWMLKKSGNERTFLFNLADPDAREWLSSYIGGFLESRGIDYYRQDFNMEPEEYWMEADEPGREGMTEVLYIEGLYKFWDSLLERFPGLLIDNCASGGRRLDLETVGRSAPLWRSDYGFGEVNGYQNQTYGLEWFLPFHGTGVYTTDTYGSRSAYSSAMVMNFKLTDIRFSFFEMKRVYDEYRMLQPYYLEDFYPLSGTEDVTSLSRWIVYQLHRPSDDTAFVLAFRRPESDDSTFTACLQGLDPAKKYTVRNMDTDEEVVLSGKDLSAGYVISLSEPRSCALFKIVPTVI
jgi:alpha-galactosidase